jgi:Flp pilus assembly protein TadG
MLSLLRAPKRGRRRSDDGAAAVEFALILPIFLLLIFLLIDFGRLFYCQITLNSAAREAARAVALRMTTAQINTAASDAAPNITGMSMNASAMTITVVSTCAVASTTLDAAAKVTVSKSFDWLLPVGVLNLITSNSTNPGTSALLVRGAMLCT